MPEDINEIKWKEFRSLIYQEIKDLKSKIEDNEIEKRRNDSHKKIYEASKFNIEILLRNKKTFIEADSSLEKTFLIIEQFKVINALDNSLVIESFNKILNSPSVIEYFDNLTKKNEEIEKTIKELYKKISHLEDLRDGIMFSDNLIVELLEKFELDEKTCLIIRRYPLLRAATKNERVVQKSVNIEEEIIEEEPQLQQTIEETEEESDLTEVPNYFDENEYYTNFQRISSSRRSENANQYRQLSNEFKNINNSYTFIMNKYIPLLNGVSKTELANYQNECDEIESQFPNIDDYENRFDYAYKKSILLTHLLLLQQNDLRRMFRQEHSNVSDLDIDEIKLSLEKYNELGQELKRIDEKLETYQDDETIPIINEESVQLLEILPTEFIEETNEEESENIEYYNNQKSRYDGLKEKYSELINKYSEIINNMKYHEKQYYSYYITLSETELEKIDDLNFNKSNNNDNEKNNKNKEARAKILAIKLFDMKQEIENTFEQITNNNFSSKDDLEYVEESINEFQSLCDKLNNMDKEITKNEIVKENEEINVYFVLDENGNVLDSVEDVYSELLGISLENFLKKKVVRNGQELKELFGKKVYIKRTSNNVISFIKTGVENTESFGILILAATSIKNNGTSKIEAETKRVASKYESIILSQLSLIEARNPAYLKIQEDLRSKKSIQTDEEESKNESPIR